MTIDELTQTYKGPKSTVGDIVSERKAAEIAAQITGADEGSSESYSGRGSGWLSSTTCYGLAASLLTLSAVKKILQLYTGNGLAPDFSDAALYSNVAALIALGTSKRSKEQE